MSLPLESGGVCDCCDTQGHIKPGSFHLVHGNTCSRSAELPCKKSQCSEATMLLGSPGHMERSRVVFLLAVLIFKSSQELLDDSSPQLLTHVQPGVFPEEVQDTRQQR